MSYVIKFGQLRGLTPEEAYQQGKVKELTELRDILKENFKNPKYAKYKEMNLEGYLAIEKVLLENYQKLLKKFHELFEHLSEEQKKATYQNIDNDVFYNNDILGIQKIIRNIESLLK